MLSLLQHPNLVRLIDYFADGVGGIVEAVILGCKHE
jgi:hypothetical protein